MENVNFPENNLNCNCDGVNFLLCHMCFGRFNVSFHMQHTGIYAFFERLCLCEGFSSQFPYSCGKVDFTLPILRRHRGRGVLFFHDFLSGENLMKIRDFKHCYMNYFFYNLTFKLSDSVWFLSQQGCVN